MIFLKTLVYSSKYAKAKSVPEEPPQQYISPSETPALRRHSPHTPTQLRLARSHARHEHETKQKQISRLGTPGGLFPPTSDKTKTLILGH